MRPLVFSGACLLAFAPVAAAQTRDRVAAAADKVESVLAQKPIETPLVDNGGIFIEAGSQSLKLGDSHTDVPLYGLGADLNGLSWITTAGVIQLGANFDVQFSRGKIGGYNVHQSTYSAGPTLCYWFLSDSSACAEADVSVMNLTKGTTSHLGAVRGGFSLRQRLSDQYMAKISYEGGDYSSGGDVKANNLLLAVSWRPLSAVR